MALVAVGCAGRGNLESAESVDAKVTRVVDGDTVKVSVDGRTETVRYIGIDTPESVKPDEPVECYGEEAGKYNEGLVEGKEVRLDFDSERRDRFGRLLAYIYLHSSPGKSINEVLVQRGYARTLTIEPNTRLGKRLDRLERRAREKGLGLWTECP